MLVRINGDEDDVPGGTTLSALLDRKGVGPEGIAVAVDGQLVRRADWARHELRPGARVEILTAVAGG